MKFGAALIADAECPGVITLGRFTWHLRDVSAPQMLRVHAARARGDGIAIIRSLLEVLSATFPRRWWHRFYGNPVKLVMSLPLDLREKVLARIFRMPGTGRSGVIDEDKLSPQERLARAQRALARPASEANKPEPTLATAVTRCRAAYGDTWYYNPQRWSTTDGYVPFRVVWVEFLALEAEDARTRLEHVAALQVLHQKAADAKRTIHEWVREAHPTDKLQS